MGVLRFDATPDWIRFQTLATPIANVSDGAFTIAVLLKQAVDGGTFQAYTYLCTAGPIVRQGLSRDSSGMLINDAGDTNGTLDIAGTTETYIAVVRKAAGSSLCTYSLFSKGAGTWATEGNGSTSLADSVAATMIEIGTFQGGSDLANAWIGLLGYWEGDMTQANVQHLDDNWRTSDWWTNPHGQPKALIECNIAAASLVDLAGNASNVLVTGTPTLDGAETLSSWNFDGTGVSSQIARPDADIAAGGWATSPLFSKLNDQSDATVISATAS